MKLPGTKSTRFFRKYFPIFMRRSYLDVRFLVLIFILLILIIIFIYSDIIRAPLSNNISQDGISQLPWWKTAVIYEIYPRSFQDSDGDGIGDLRGIISKVDYLKDLGIGAVWLAPIYPSPMVDFGYDIINFTDIDPIFGSLDDLDQLQLELKARGIKLIMDFVPNHTSNLHEWFQKSIKRIDPYTDYYVWKDPKGFNATGHPIPPNNWISVYKSTWEWNQDRQQFYLHHYEKEQPDLNVRFPEVMNELDRVIKFWLNRGIDGIRLDAIARLFEAADVYQDAPIDEAVAGKVSPNYRSYLKQIYTTNQPETFDAIRRWRRILDTYENRMMMAEVFDAVQEVMQYYGNEENPLAHFPFNFFLISNFNTKSQVTGDNLKKVLDEWLHNMPKGKWPNWVLGNHDVQRISSRMGVGMIDAMNMITLLLIGTPVTYYGEEIGMEDTFISYKDAKDPRGVLAGSVLYLQQGRDPERTPMQWNQSHNAGFSTAIRTWLPVNNNYKKLNVANQLEASQSHLKIYKSLTRLRMKKTFSHGHFDYSMVSKDIFSFIRHLEGEDSYLIVVNTSSGSLTVDLLLHSEFPLPKEGTILIRSTFDERVETQPGSLVSLASLPLLPKEGLVINLSS